MSKTNYLEAALLNHILRNTAYASPAAVYVSLFTAVTSEEAGTITEVALGDGYARVAGVFADPAGVGVTSNSVETLFGEATDDLGTVTHFGIHDAAAGGNLLYVGALDTPFDYDTGVQPRFPIGALDITED